jgi:hypothetical protein
MSAQRFPIAGTRDALDDVTPSADPEDLSLTPGTQASIDSMKDAILVGKYFY